MKKSKVTTTLKEYLNYKLWLGVNEFRCMDDMKKYQVYGVEDGNIKYIDNNDVIRELSDNQLVEFTLEKATEERMLDAIYKLAKVNIFIEKWGKLGITYKEVIEYLKREL